MSLSTFLLTIKWFQVLLYNCQNITSVNWLLPDPSIWHIDKTLAGATPPDQSGPGSNSNEEVLHIPQIFKARALPSVYLISYPGHSLVVVG